MDVADDPNARRCLGMAGQLDTSHSGDDGKRVGQQTSGCKWGHTSEARRLRAEMPDERHMSPAIVLNSKPAVTRSPPTVATRVARAVATTSNLGQHPTPDGNRGLPSQACP